jgi:hypothetical protein
MKGKYMGVYYDFYLDKNISEDKWSSVIVNDNDIIFYMRSRNYLYDEYSTGFPLDFKYLSQEFQEKNKEEYESLEKYEKIGYCNFYHMDLERMKKDFDNDIHEYAGIISKNSYKHLQSNCDYNAKIIEEEVYAKFSPDIKENYMYYEWDDTCSEYYYLYEIMPIIEKALKDNNLEYKDVRLLCNIC